MSKRTQIIGLDWLRFIAGIYVVLFHTLPRYPVIEQHTLASAILDLGNFATSVFFVLSGFLLSHIYVDNTKEGIFDSRKFLIGRFSTLYPLHLLALLFAAPSILALIVIYGGVAYTEIPPGNSVHVLSWSQASLSFLATLMLTHAWNPWYIPFNAPSWSLSALFFFYVVFVFVAPRMRVISKPFYALVALGIVFAIPGILVDYLNVSNQTVEGLLHRNPVIRLPLFLGGMILSLLYSRKNNKPGNASPKGLSAILCMVVMATLATAMSFQIIYEDERLHFIQNGLYFPAALAIVWLSASMPMSNSELSKRWSLRLGKTALPLFLIHFPLFDLFSRGERFILFFVKHDGEGLTFQALANSARNAEQTIWLYPVFLIALLIVAVLVQERFVEPVQKRIRERFSSRRRVKLELGQELYPVSRQPPAEISKR